jgi:hypothetical protein
VKKRLIEMVIPLVITRIEEEENTSYQSTDPKENGERGTDYLLPC